MMFKLPEIYAYIILLYFLIISYFIVVYSRGAQIPGARSPERPKFVLWRLMFVGPQCGTCSMSPFWRVGILRWLLDFWKICVPWRVVYLQMVQRTTP
jgi:hypothetical protein